MARLLLFLRGRAGFAGGTGTNFLVDDSGNFLVDDAGNFLMDA